MSIQMNLDNGSEKIKGYVKSQSDSNRAFRAPGAYKEVKQAIETLDLNGLQDAGTNSSNTDASDIDLDSSETLDDFIKLYDETIKEMEEVLTVLYVSSDINNEYGLFHDTTSYIPSDQLIALD